MRRFESFWLMSWLLVTPAGCSRSRAEPLATPTTSVETPPAVAPAASLDAAEPAAPPRATGAPPPEPRFGYADTDPDNDRTVAPPDAIPECDARLRELGAEFSPGELPLRSRVREIPTCGANDAVILTKLSDGLALRPPALLTCTMALGLAHFAPRLQELAEAELGTRVKTIHHVGTYNCRKMVRFDLVSEHSYGNAIDVGAFTLEDGRRLEVKRDFGALAEEAKTPSARFLRRLGNVAFDEDFFSVSLGPYWDALHKDHFHFDQARYRVDGSRP